MWFLLEQIFEWSYLVLQYHHKQGCQFCKMLVRFNTLMSGLIQAVRKKNSWFARGFAWEYLRSCTGYGPGRSVKRRRKSCSLHSKKTFCLGGAVFCQWGHKWRTFWPPWPTLPGHGRQPLDGSISLKVLLDSKLQSESFDTLDDWGFGFKSYDLS